MVHALFGGVQREEILILNYDEQYTIPFYVENPMETTIELYFYYNTNESGILNIPIERSYDNNSWTSIGTLTKDNVETNHVQLEPNQRVYFRANTPTWYEDNGNGSAHLSWSYQSIDCSLIYGGNIMSLLYGSNFTGRETTFPANSSNNFQSLFNASIYTYDASNLILPATELTPYCYCCLLWQQEGNTLENAPVLAKATTLAEGCYDSVTGLGYGSAAERAMLDSEIYINNPLYEGNEHGWAITYSVN